ncbi:MAG: ATP-dependent Clp protease ATP-binding subunit [Myxococcota bacterium]|nr:ATP-dependent Clp protease ATP-binding subunit [Myxococcota bacterium]
MKALIEHATALAEKARTPLQTGHFLLAMIAAQGTAAKLLKLRGLTQAKITEQLRAFDREPNPVVPAAIEKAQQISRPFSMRDPSPLHLLAVITGMREANAYKLLKDLGCDTMGIRNQALRCLTSATDELSADKNPVPDRVGPNDALPVAAQLRMFTPVKPPEGKPPERSSQASPAVTRQRSLQPGLQAGPNRRSRGLGTKHLIDMGRELEKKQRQKMAGAAPPAAVTVRPKTTKPIPATARNVDLPLDRFPLLASLGRNLTTLAIQGRLDTIVGRNREMVQMADILNKRRANAPCLVGPAGVGKTALVEGLAIALSQGRAPGLTDRAIIEVKPADLLSGTSARGALAERLEQLILEITAANGQAILFFDEIHALLGSNEGAEAIQQLKTSLGRGELPCIAATTEAAYIHHIEGDPALCRRFAKVVVGEPSEAEAIEILRGVTPAYQEHHDVGFTTAAITAAVQLSTRYMNNRALPDKAIALLDLAGARARRKGTPSVDVPLVAEVIAEQLNVPAESLAANDQERLLNLESALQHRIVGHGHALIAIGETLRRNAAGFRTSRPIGSFLFLGPTGVGKTETAKALADVLFPGSNNLVRIDMSELSEAHAVARLIGAPPGYVGHEEGGQLTQAVQNRPYCLVLLDEIEKAHPDVLKLLLQVLDDGRLTDGLGRTVVFQNTVMVMTSNLGSDLRTHRRHVGFGAKQRVEKTTEIADAIIARARETLLPELWNRIDEPLVFNPLTQDEVSEIAGLLLSQMSMQLYREHQISLQLEPGVIDALITAGGYDPDLGARPMRRTIQRLIEGPVANLVLRKEATSGDTVIVTVDDHTFNFTTAAEEVRQID